MGSVFAPASHRRLPERIPYPVTVTIGTPMRPDSSLFELRQAISELGQQAWSYRKRDRRPLHHEFVRRARRHPSRLAFADFQTPRVSYFKALAGALAIARSLRTALGGPGGRGHPPADERGRRAGEPGRGDGRPGRRQPELHRRPGRDGVGGRAGGPPHGRHQPGLPREGQAPAAVGPGADLRRGPDGRHPHGRSHRRLGAGDLRPGASARAIRRRPRAGEQSTTP